MGSKKGIVTVCLSVVLVICGLVGYSWRHQTIETNTFATSGYMLTAEPGEQGKQALFAAGAPWKENLNNRVVFEDVQGQQIAVDSKSFAHYDDQSLSAMSNGVIVDLNDVQNAQVTNHYPIASTVRLTDNGDGYVPTITSELAFKDFLWKVDLDKYMLVSSGIRIHFSDDDVREAQGFVEISYIDGGVIQLQTADNVWQTISEECYATLSNGTEVNLSQRNVSGFNGQVLIDFSKIVLDANYDVERTPLTEELKNLAEAVIPHFDITAKQGKAGAEGSGGTNGNGGTNGDSGTEGELGFDGSNGESGLGGAAGSSGRNGGAGSSGTNGSAGSAGSSGSNGQDGSLAESDGNVLNFPVFTLEDWALTATSCSATIKVADKGGMLLDNDPAGLHSSVYLVDTATSTVKASMDPAPEFSTLDANGYQIAFSGLDPDHAYRLVVSAPINTREDNAQDYLRDFISKSFWTDSAGVYLEAGGSGVSSLNLSVYRQNYASSALKDSATVYLFNNLDAAFAAAPSSSGSVAGSIAMEAVTLGPAGQSAACFFGTGLSSNTTYYARIVVQVGNSFLMPEQVLSLTTLKSRAVVGAPTLTPNRGSWGFDITPGAVYDPDKGITGYAYEFYNETDIKNGMPLSGRTAVKTVRTGSGDGLTVPLDGTALIAGRGYYVRAVASFDDNEKTSQLVTLCSNLAKLDGSKLPSVYFVNSGSGSPDGGSSAAADTSGWYDQIYGTVMIAPGVDGAKVLLDSTHHPVVTFRASGYYYVQYPVYLENDAPADGSAFLTGRRLDGGYIQIDVPGKALLAGSVSASGAVNGLKPDTQYRILVTGDLSNDGQNAFESNTLIGSCVVRTPATVSVRTTWLNSSAAGSSKFSTTLKLSAPQTGAESAFGRQMETISSVHLALNAGSKDNPGKELGGVTITDGEARKYNPDAENLGELMTKGIALTEASFGLKGTELAGLSTVHITLSQVNDYTARAENRLNQKAYAVNESEDTSAPPSSSADGAVYVNAFKITGTEGAVHDIQLSASPDPIPNPGEGMTVTPHDDDKDGISDNSYTLAPNYLNTGKLAKTITFYAFDYPDFHANYSAAEWALSSDYPNDRGIPLTAVTAVNKKTRNGTWLASVTLSIPQNGKMPAVRFVPQSATSYYTALYEGDTEAISKAVAKYDDGKGGVTDDKGAYLLFYNGSHQAEPATGHQFVYAWTMTYRLEGEQMDSYYPFALAEYGSYQSIPHSKPYDAPRHAPDFYALPWTSDANGVSWATYFRDTQGVVLLNASRKAALYERSSAVGGAAVVNSTGDPVAAPVFLDPPGDINAITANKVTIAPTKNGSTAVAVRVQWYTDKYTVDGGGLFINDTVKGYTEDTCRYSKYRQSAAGGKYIIPYYSNVFTYYHDGSDFADNLPTTGISVQLQEKTPDESTPAVNRYEVTLQGTIDTLKKADGLRLRFIAKGNEIVLDKYLEGVDAAAVADNGDNTCTVKCNLSISGELGAIAGQTGVRVVASLLYESGAEGFAAVGSGTSALRSYRALQDNAVGWSLQPSGRYRFNAAGALADNQESDGALLPRMGSFFELDNWGLTSMRVTSTRNSIVTQRQATMNFALDQAVGAQSGALVIAPRALLESGVNALQITDKNGAPLNASALSIPKITPVIVYSNSVAGANNLESNYSVTGAEAKNVKFLLQKRVGNSWVIQVKDAAGQWVDNTDPMISYSEPGSALQAMTAAGHLVFSGVASDTAYRITGFYRDDDGKDKPLNMLTLEGREITNYLDLITSAEPEVTLKASYKVSTYFYKRIHVDLAISKAVGYYYTLELQKLDADGNEQFITYLDMGDSAKGADGLTDIFEVGALGAREEITQKEILHGALYKAVGFKTDGTLERTGERVYLDYGAAYQVRVRMYNSNKGPAFGGDTTDDLLHTPEGQASATKRLPVLSEDDQVNLTGAYQLLPDDTNTLTPTIVFSPSYLRASSTLRGDKYAVVVVRSRVDAVAGQIAYEDVTSQFSVSGAADAIDPSVNVLSLTSLWKLRLAGNQPDLFQKGDKFTCYLYAIQDDRSALDTKGYNNAQDTTRESILAGRRLESGDNPLASLNKASEAVDKGTSLLAASLTVEYTSTSTSAGTVSVTKNANDFTIVLTNPVDPQAITHMAWSVTALYVSAQTAGVPQTLTVSSGSGSILQTPVHLTQIGTNIYQITLSPDFKSLPDDAQLINYTVTLQFYQQKEDGSYDSSGIGMEAGANSSVSQADGGIRLTTVIQIDTVKAAILSLEMNADEIPPEELPPTESLPDEVPPVETPPAEDLPDEVPPAETPPTEELPEETPPVEDPPAESLPEETPPTAPPPEEDPPAPTPPAETTQGETPATGTAPEKISD